MYRIQSGYLEERRSLPCRWCHPKRRWWCKLNNSFVWWTLLELIRRTDAIMSFTHVSALQLFALYRNDVKVTNGFTINQLRLQCKALHATLVTATELARVNCAWFSWFKIPSHFLHSRNHYLLLTVKDHIFRCKKEKKTMIIIRFIHVNYCRARQSPWIIATIQRHSSQFEFANKRRIERRHEKNK